MDMGSFAATTGMKVVQLESQLRKTEDRIIKLEAYTRRSNLRAAVSKYQECRATLLNSNSPNFVRWKVLVNYYQIWQYELALFVLCAGRER